MKIFIVAALLVMIVSAPALANKQPYGNATVSRVTTIYDGDTFTAQMDSWPPIIGQSISVRIYGIDTPELRGKCKREIDLARKAKQFTVEMIRSAKKIELRSMRRDKYFRILAIAVADGKVIGDELIKAGLAVPYYGAKKISWCD